MPYLYHKMDALNSRLSKKIASLQPTHVWAVRVWMVELASTFPMRLSATVPLASQDSSARLVGIITIIVSSLAFHYTGYLGVFHYTGYLGVFHYAGYLGVFHYTGYLGVFLLCSLFRSLSLYRLFISLSLYRLFISLSLYRLFMSLSLFKSNDKFQQRIMIPLY